MTSDTMDLVLISPGGQHSIYQHLAASQTAIEPPIWTSLLASCAEKAGYRVAIIDANALRISPSETAQRAVSLSPKLVGIVVYGHNPSASTQIMPAAAEICAELKILSPELKLILLGGHVTALPQQTMEEESCDYVCSGEGPATLLELLKRLQMGDSVDGSQIPDLWYRSNGKILRSEHSAPLLQKLDQTLPGSAWHLLPMDQYRAHDWHTLGHPSRTPYAAIYTTLGCPYSCSFCCIQAPFRSAEKASGLKPEISSYRFWPPSFVLEQIDLLVQRYGVKHLKIADEMFVLNRLHIEAICSGLIERGYDLNLWAYARVDTAKDPALLKKMRAAGFRWLVLGIESADNQTRARVEKDFRQQDIYESVQMIREAGIYILANYIFGLPDETMESMERTLSLALELNTEHANFYCSMAYPGSSLYRSALKNGVPLPQTWSGYSQHGENSFPMPSKHLNSEAILRFRDRAFQRYFSSPAYLNMIASTFGVKAADSIRLSAAAPLKRNLFSESLPA